MELPPALRQAVDLALQGHSPSALARAAEQLSARYRGEVRDGTLHLAEDLAARAYLAVRLPATFAAVRAAMEFVGERRPDWSPHSLLDVGSGPGTAIWAAESRWGIIPSITAIEASQPIGRLGQQLLESGSREGGSRPPGALVWETADLTGGLPNQSPRDLVTVAYVLNELSPEQQSALIDRLWALTADTLLIVEPGTPAGWQRILAARQRLIAAGAQLIAPCPHAAACPLAAPDWCHFSRRVARTRVHQLVKDVELAWEDEKYLYLAVTRTPLETSAGARILIPPRHGSGRVLVKLCTPAGRAEERLITKREGEIYKRARRSDWGDSL
jgi:ribosomal protein RSM22 (predicted rRNA methylase)